MAVNNEMERINNEVVV